LLLFWQENCHKFDLFSSLLRKISAVGVGLAEFIPCKCTAEDIVLLHLRYSFEIIGYTELSENAGSHLWYISWWIPGTNICSTPSKESKVLGPVKYFS